MIDSWRRKKGYHFWTARLRDSFRFEPVRALARQVRVRFRVSEVELSPPNPDAKVPVVVGSMVGELLEVA